MYNETIMTIQGRVATDPQVRQAGTSTVANFRVACTPRRHNRSDGTWSDGPTQWYSVSAWRLLGEHCARSLHRGDAVIVQGRLDAQTYVNKNNVEVLDLCIDATSVGHDLSWGTTTFTRYQSPQSEPAERTPFAEEPPVESAA